MVMSRATALVLSFTAYGLTIFVFSAYFIMTDVSPRSNFRMYSLIVTSCFILWAFCEYCQRVTNESEKVFHNACRCPWEQFNNTNRRILLMLLSNSISPVTISCHGVLDANYPLAVKFFRMAYAAHTLFTNMSQNRS
ncbi:uncharacterized protein [Leptinotarsa decemlineata]|uniref:uncharacterized protein n=1 Tax=Leptinotarsa decemlineata TaxID=7539 RepID=UPI000C2528A0|nr:uncharacterized protein LOC111518076 [Leptinotarsa decemlineata]